MTKDLGIALCAHQTALTYVRGAMLNPVSLSLVAFAACVGIGYAGAIGAVIALAAYIVVGVTSTRSAYIRRQIDRQLEYRLSQRRDSDRLCVLKPAGPMRQQQYCDLRDLVCEIERTDAAEAERFELQQLLDHFVALAADHQRCLDSLRFAGSNDLPRALPIPDTRSARRREITARRLHQRDECMRRIERLADDLEAIDELVRLVAQRAAAPELHDDVDRELERRLCELDEVDAAMSQLSA